MVARCYKLSRLISLITLVCSVAQYMVASLVTIQHYKEHTGRLVASTVQLNQRDTNTIAALQHGILDIFKK